MRFSLNSTLLLLKAIGCAKASEAEGSNDVKNVAIIGAGAAGSSAAYYLGRYAIEEGLPGINITVFEKTDRIGGRSLTANAYDDPLQPIELGASIFVKVNQILYNATESFGLEFREPNILGDGDLTGIWDGQKFVFETTEGSSWWWDAAKMFWKYGLSPYRAVKLVNKVVGDFLKLYEEPYFPFRSLTQRVYELGLEKITGVTGVQFLAANNIDARFSNEILQAATRVNYASNLAYIHGLETMVSFATDGAVAVKGGNWQIFDQMVSRSEAALYRNTSVTHITKKHHSSKYHISTKHSKSKLSSSEKYPVAFDNVIVATPWQFGDIKAGDGVLMSTIDKIPYTKLHVTLFTSPLKLRGEYFGLEPGSKAPSCVYTTLGENEEPKQGAEGVGSAGFYSISTLKTVVNPKTGRREYVYKIFSPKPVTSEFLTDILGAKVPETFVPPEQGKEGDGEPDTFDPISWYYPHWFHSYPIELPRVTFQDPIVGGGVYYTSGIESFISTMETSALMGRNVARLIIDDFAGISRDVADPDYVSVVKPEEAEADSIRKQPLGEL